MLTDTKLDQLFTRWGTPTAGRQLIRTLRRTGPVRKVESRMDGVRVRHISKKMNGMALYAESRTVEYPNIFQKEFDLDVLEMWPQPCKVDMVDSGRRTRLQHTPDLFVITAEGFVMEEWREEKRLLKLAATRPEHFYKDDDGNWHFAPAEEHFERLGIKHRLRSADELQRKYIANLHFLEDYTLETAPAVSQAERRRLTDVMAENSRMSLMELLTEKKFVADDIYQLILDRTVYVDLEQTLLNRSLDLVLYKDKAVCQADALLAAQKNQVLLPEHALVISQGSKFAFDGKPFEVLVVGDENVVAVGEDGKDIVLPISLIEKLHKQELLLSNGPQVVLPEYNATEIINANRLDQALEKLEYLNNPGKPGKSERSIRRYKQLTRGLSTPQEMTRALMSVNPGNTQPRLPDKVMEIAKAVVKDFHNTVPCPTKWSSYQTYITRCMAANIAKPMSKSAFYRWIDRAEDIEAREGKRKKYQKDAIPLTFDYDQPVHGQLAHDVVYIDHTIPNIFLKGDEIEDLGKPTLTIATDGALSMTRAFYLSYRPPGTESVMMVLRDYVRRHGRLPKTIVLDNGKEFHSTALKQFCSAYGITIRWRRRSKPRDSTLVERALGATETEVIAQLEGNSIALKNPRMVSSTHNPQKHIKWSLAPLHGALDYYFFEVKANAVHPRFGMSPREKEKRLVFEKGARSHVLIPYDSLFRLMTAPHSGAPERIVDRQRGVFVDGMHYWHDKLAHAHVKESCEVRCEPWRARVVYVRFRDEWLVAQARDGGRLEGRYTRERDLQIREERRRKKTAAQTDKQSPWQAEAMTKVWDLRNWDPKVRAQMTDEYRLYEALGMCEALEAAKNPSGGDTHLPVPKTARLSVVMNEPDVLPDREIHHACADSPAKPPVTNPKDSTPVLSVAVASSSDGVDEDDYFYGEDPD